MNQIHLRKIRIVVSLIVFVSLLFLFLGISLPPFNLLETVLLRLQFLPSLLRLLALSFSVTALGFLLVTLLSLVFGRVYCSGICPLGTFQDIVSALARRLKPRKKRRYMFSAGRKRIFRYTVLGLTAGFWAFGSLFLVNLLDPFSNFGKISVSLFQPAYIWLHNSIVFFLERFDVFIWSPLSLHALPLDVVFVSLAVFVVISVMAALRGRLFCNTLCPVGSILSLVAVKPLVRIRFNEEACAGCRRCEWVCKAECLDSARRTIDYSRCINCFNCFSSCPQGGIRYQTHASGGNSKTFSRQGNEKRQFLLGFAGALVSLPLLGRKAMAQGRGGGGHGRRRDYGDIVAASKPGMIPIDVQYPVTPPGSISHKHFTGHCIACYLCVSACPTKVIVPSFFTYGLEGFMQPTLDFHRSFCNYDCVKCTEVCPTGAITRQTPEEKRLIQIGVVRFLVESCVVTVDRTDCGACSEHCPTKAVQMVRWEDGLFIPEITPSLCTGCGACEFACPTEPYKAIYVHGRKEHRQARAIDDRRGPRTEEPDDFPF
ncbi:MAG: 4Fe-4S binding protein [Bacteroidales bacterium]|nr:4Fe-4S binding protein [Bacteroidales bacterium]